MVGNKETPAASSAARQRGKNVRVALILQGEISDQSWNAVGYHGLAGAKEKLGIETAYRESVKPLENEVAFCDFARQGYDLVIGHGSGFSEAAVKAAEKCPETLFAVTNSDVTGPNLAGLDTKNEEMGYLAGYIAGLLSKSKVVAFIGGMKIVAMTRAERGFIAGAKAASPDCDTLTAYIGTIDTEEVGRKIGLDLIAQKADVLFNNAEIAGLGLMKAAEEQGVLAIGNDCDQKAVAPGAIVTSILINMTPMILSIVQEVVDDAFKPEAVRRYGFDTGTYDLAPLDLSRVSQAQADKIDAVKAQLIAGEIKFSRPSASSEA